MRWMLDLVVAFLLVGLGEALVKPIAKRFVQRRILRVAIGAVSAVDLECAQCAHQLRQMLRALALYCR